MPSFESHFIPQTAFIEANHFINWRIIENIEVDGLWEGYEKEVTIPIRHPIGSV